MDTKNEEILLHILLDGIIIAEVNNIQLVSHAITSKLSSYRDFVFNFSTSQFSKMNHRVDILSEKKSIGNEAVAQQKYHKFCHEYGYYPHTFTIEKLGDSDNESDDKMPLENRTPAPIDENTRQAIKHIQAQQAELQHKIQALKQQLNINNQKYANLIRVSKQQDSKKPTVCKMEQHRLPHGIAQQVNHQVQSQLPNSTEFVKPEAFSDVADTLHRPSTLVDALRGGGITSGQQTRTILGVLFDFSDSMSRPLSALKAASNSEGDVQKAQTIISILLDIFSQEAERHCHLDQVFVEGYGLSSHSPHETCDLIELINNVPDLSLWRNQPGNAYEKLTALAIQYNAAHLANWVRSAIPNEDEAAVLYLMLRNYPAKVQQLLAVIPSAFASKATQSAIQSATKSATYVAGQAKYIAPIFSPLPSMNFLRTDDSMDTVVAKRSAAGKLVYQFIDEAVKEAQSHIVPVAKMHNASSTAALMRRLFGEAKAPEPWQVKALFAFLKPFLYGATPMLEAVSHAYYLLEMPAQHKVLVIISDGSFSDGDPRLLAKQLRENHGVLVVTCFLTHKCIYEPKKLHYKANSTWSKGEKLMFELSSTLPNTCYALSVLARSNNIDPWILPKEGETRLFLRANRLSIIDEFFQQLIAHLTDIVDLVHESIGLADLTCYINDFYAAAVPTQQIGNACYANAVGFVFHAAAHRIVGRARPSFYQIRQDIISVYRDTGASTLKVLSEQASKYHLSVSIVDEEGARHAINQRRPVIATFGLSASQQKHFLDFYKATPKGILRRNDLGPQPTNKEPLAGHAVILMRTSPASLKFMNSWGSNWADNGFFSISDAEVLNNAAQPIVFYDVCCEYITKDERDAFKEYSIQTSKALAEIFPSVWGVKIACESCKEINEVGSFTGNFSKAICPACNAAISITGRSFVF